jgi:plasmid maintenance system antidote protein VapI
VAATRAAELIRQGEWHSAEERAHPQQVIESTGLTGGEIVLLAEDFGSAEVVQSSDFAKMLKSGRPVLIGVVPADGNLSGGHAVVLSKTFQKGGETWFEMMDSYHDHPLYLSKKELSTILLVRGVAYRPEKGTVPKL